MYRGLFIKSGVKEIAYFKFWQFFNSLIEKSRKNINNAVPFVKHPRGSTRDARYNLNWTSYSDYPIVFYSYFTACWRLLYQFFLPLQILEFIYELAAKYPQLMSVSTIGKTYLGLQAQTNFYEIDSTWFDSFFCEKVMTFLWSRFLLVAPTKSP